MNSGFAFLANVNETVNAMAFDNQPIPAHEPSLEDCQAIDNCTLPGGTQALTWNTQYSATNTCESPEFSYGNGKEKDEICLNFYNF
jgi:hypothetical protein